MKSNLFLLLLGIMVVMMGASASHGLNRNLLEIANPMAKEKQDKLIQDRLSVELNGDSLSNEAQIGPKKPEQKSKDEAIRLGLFYGTNNLLGLNADWFFFSYNISLAGSLYYRNGDSLGDYILGSDIMIKKYNTPIKNNNIVVYEGIGGGYASVYNPIYGEIRSPYGAPVKYDYFCFSGLLGVEHFGDIFDNYLEVQPITGKDGIKIFLKIGLVFNKW